MHFHPELGPPPTVGLEFEVTVFKTGRTFLDVSRALYSRGMCSKTYVTGGRHDWHHPCDECRAVGSEVFFPVRWKLERDSSLPNYGCEFISSPFPVADMFVESAMNALDEICRRSVWNNTTDNQRGLAKAEAGFHVHTYAKGIQLNGDWNLTRLMHIMYLYLPELFTLAQSTNVERSLEFRLPSDNAQNHHSWIAFPRLDAGQRGFLGPENRIEWRLWEAPVDDPAYLEGVIYLSAALSQLAYDEKVLDEMEKIGVLLPWSKKNLSMKGILNETSYKKLKFLQFVVNRSSHLVEDERGSEAVNALFDRVS